MRVNGMSRDSLAISDRGLAYGDGVFETIRIHRHRAVLMDRHLDRLVNGAARLRIGVDRPLLETEIAEVEDEFPAAGILKIIVTRGTGGRGYQPGTTSEPTRILSLHPMPGYSGGTAEQGIDVFVCRQRLARQPALAGLKHLNRLEQVLASLEWPDGDYMEGLMLDTEGIVVEGTRSNLFWAEAGQLYTPDLSQCGVAGIMRNYLMDKVGNVMESNDCTLARLCGADEVFFCNSIFGLWPVNRIHAGETEAVFDPDPGKRRYSNLGRNIFSDLLDSCQGE